jgi:subfamily B ATP-binding cassette protein MsbA
VSELSVQEATAATASRYPFSTRSPAAFYVSLMRRYWRLLALMALLTAIYSGLSALRLGALGLLVDVVDETGAPKASGKEPAAPEAKDDPPRDRAKILKTFEEWWKKLLPASMPPPTVDLRSPGGVTRFLKVFAAILCALALVLGGLYFAKEYLSQLLVVRMVVDVRKSLFNQLTLQEVSYFHDRRLGDLLSRTTNDVDLIQRSLRFLYENIFQQPLTILFSMLVACLAHPLLFLVAVPVWGLVTLPVLRSGRKVYRHTRDRQEKLGLITESLQQLFGGIRVVKAFGMERREREDFDKKNRSFVRYFMRVRRAKIRARFFQEIFYHLALAGLIVAGAWLLTNPGSLHIDKGSFVTFFVALMSAYNPLKQVTKAWQEVQESLPGAERVLEVLRRDPLVRDRPGARDFPGLRETISFERVSFSYQQVPGLEAAAARGPSRAAAVSEIDLGVNRGEVVALVGASGGGKSTLVDLLARFYEPQEGCISVDGVDIREFRLGSYLEAIAIVSQDPFLFNTTIRENIRCGREGASDDEVVAAAKVANAHGFILEQPQGYDTVIGERGAKLSGGQRQRLTIARAVLKNAPILILDEATSALDSEAEREVQQAIDVLLRERTTFVIAHRLSTVIGADKICVLEDGRIVETGRHQELLDQRGRYWRLYSSQTKAEERASRAASRPQGAATEEVRESGSSGHLTPSSRRT